MKRIKINGTNKPRRAKLTPKMSLYEKQYWERVDCAKAITKLTDNSDYYKNIFNALLGEGE